MGQKVHPYGFRLGTLYGWQSNWFAEKRYVEQLHEDIKIRTFVKKKLYHAGISRVVIDRTGEKVVLNIHTARPGILIGKRGAEVETLREELAVFTNNKEVFVNIKEIRKAELDAQLVAENVALQLQKRVAFRRAMKKAVTSALRLGADGIRIACAGRLGGAEIARRGVKVLAGVEYRRIDERGLHVVHEGAEKVLEVDHVVLCAGQEPVRGLHDELAGRGVRSHLIGGAHVAAELDAFRAIDEGTRVALSL